MVRRGGHSAPLELPCTATSLGREDSSSLDRAIAIPPSAFRGLAVNGRRLVVALGATSVALPALSWAVSHLVHTLALRRGVLTVGVAPAEIASVATTSLAGGEAVAAAGMLVGSTLVSVAAAGIGLRLLGGGGSVRLLPLLTNLALVVGAPMVVGIAIRSRVTLSEGQEAAAERLSVAVVTLLVWLVASNVRLSSSYLAVTAALLLFLAGSAVLGVMVGRRPSGAGPDRDRSAAHHLHARPRRRSRHRRRRLRRRIRRAPRPLRRHRHRMGMAVATLRSHGTATPGPEQWQHGR